MTRRSYIALEMLRRMKKDFRLTYVCLLKEPIFPKRLSHLSTSSNFSFELLVASYRIPFFILSLLYVNLSLLLSLLRQNSLKKGTHLMLIHSVEYFPFLFIILPYMVARCGLLKSMRHLFIYDFVDLYLLVNKYPAKHLIRRLLSNFERFLVKEASIIILSLIHI